MKKIHLIYCTFFILLFNACMDEPIEYDNTREGNFEALWNIVDTRYCYLEYKNIDWQAIGLKYRTKLPSVKNNLELFDLFGEMLGELKDGHVNLYSDFDKSRYWKWYTDYPDNFDSDIIYSDRYLADNYRIAGPFRYQKIANGTIGYMYYGSFASDFSDSNMAYIAQYFSKCKGLIVDVRNNGGGSIDMSQKLASYFFKTETITGYMRHKIGNGHNDFSEPTEIKTPSHEKIQYTQHVVILSNRMSYSATNDFINRMQQAPNATIVGDKTGGGGGLPLSAELPNGWLVRFSACPMYNSDMQHTEWGIEPDVKVQMSATDALQDIDTIIEKAIEIINSKP